MNNYIVLKRPVKSRKFGILFPANVKLHFTTIDNVHFVEHPNHKNIFTKASEKNIKEKS
jgi:hypothetical protein